MGELLNENFNKLNFNLKFIYEKGININLKEFLKKLFFDKVKTNDYKITLTLQQE